MEILVKRLVNNYKLTLEVEVTTEKRSANEAKQLVLDLFKTFEYKSMFSLVKVVNLKIEDL